MRAAVAVVFSLLLTVVAHAGPDSDQIYRSGTLPRGRLTVDEITQVLSAGKWTQPNSAKKYTTYDSHTFEFGAKDVVVTRHEADSSTRAHTYPWKVVRRGSRVAIQIDTVVFALSACRGIKDHVCLEPSR